MTLRFWHEWRKRAKDHLFHIRLFENVWTDELKQHESCLHELESVLGDDHNLLVLRERLRADHKRTNKDEGVKRLVEMLREHRKQLREKASSLGEIAYRRKPAAFSKEVAGLAEELLTVTKPAKKASAAKKKAAA